MLKGQDFHYFFKLARPGNLLIALCTFSIAAYFSAGRQYHFFQDFNYYWEALLIVCAMTGGYWINDVFDFKVDRINKPERTFVGSHISTKKVITAYIVVTGFVLLASWLLPRKFIILNGAACTALLLYAWQLKQRAVLGNLVVASLTAAVVLAGAFLFELKLPLAWMMVFAFLATFIREVIKDVEDIRGDMRFGLRTLPILLGIRVTKQVLLFSYLGLIIACALPFATHIAIFQQFQWPYLFASIVLVQGPLIYGLVLLAGAYRPTDFAAQSRLLKAIIGGGLVSLLFLA